MIQKKTDRMSNDGVKGLRGNTDWGGYGVGDYGLGRVLGGEERIGTGEGMGWGIRYWGGYGVVGIGTEGGMGLGSISQNYECMKRPHVRSLLYMLI